MPNFNIRLSRCEEAELLPLVDLKSAQIFRAVKDLAWIADSDMMSAQKHLKFIARQSSWVAEEMVEGRAGKLLGFICTQPLGAYLHIAQLSVDRRYQKQGIGKKLIGTCIQYAQSKGYKAVTLTTFRHVPWNMPWYARLGFEVLSEEELSAELKAVLAQEVEMGLVAEQRCAMRLYF